MTTLAGVTLGLYAAQTGGTPLFTCTSDADGDCNFTVTATGSGGANRNKHYWVRQETTGVPSGWFVNQTLRTGDANGITNTPTPYAFQTPALIGGTTYSSTGLPGTTSFMLSSGNAANASGGIWQQSRTNPTLMDQCGISVALVLDLSGSVGDTGNLANLKTAADTFTDALVGTPSRMALFSFSAVSPASGATQNYPTLVPVSTAAQATTFKARYAGWTAGGYTNWDRGLAVAAATASTYNVVVMITDGNPTVYNDPSQGPGGSGRVREMENAIFSANAVKQAGARVIVFGVGSGASSAVTASNLAAISGQTKYDGSNTATADYYQTADYAAAGTALRNLALGNCTGTVTVVKQVVPFTAPIGSTTGAQPAGGWTFTPTATNGASVTPNPGVTQPGTGAVNFALAGIPGAGSTTFGATETQQSGYTLQQVGAANAVCTNLITSTGVTVTNQANGFNVPVGPNDAISCTVYNRAPTPQADITLQKTWVINGQTYADGAQPSVFSAKATLTGPGAAGATPQGWGVTRGGYSVGDTATVAETTTITGPTLCTVDSSKVTAVNGTTLPTPAGLPYAASLSLTSNNVTVTNTVTCDSRLTLVKSVANGPASPASWTLSAIPPTGSTLSGATGDPAITNAVVTPNVTYQLKESAGDPRYVQDDNRTNLQTNPLSTGSMTCVQLDTSGNIIPGYSDGINGGVSVPLGYSVRCTATNRTAGLTLIKHVINDNGGNNVAGDWNLTATPTAPPAVPDGLLAQTVTGAELPGASIWVRPGQPYALTETTVPGYLLTGISCTTTSIPTPQSLTSITLAAGQTGVCTYTNDDQPPHLTLVKNVSSPYGGTAVAGDWTLTADGTGGFSGAGGTAAVANQPVRANTTYTLAESTVAGYANGATWSCTAGTFTSPNQILLAPGANATCTIINTEVQPKLTLVKKVFDQAGNDITTPALAAQWTLTATGTGGFSGAGNSAAVTAIGVNSNTTYTLSETTVPGYTNGATWSCTAGGTFTSPNQIVLSSGADITCSIGNDRNAIAVTLRKAWVNGKSGDTAALNINGATTAPGQNTSTSTGAAGTQLDTTHLATATVGAGNTVSLAETLGALNAGGYVASLSCVDGNGNPVTVTGAGGSGSFTAPNSGSVVCTVTNTRTSASLTLAKSWVNGFSLNNALLTITGAGQTGSGTATATVPAGGSGPSTETVIVTAYSGDTATVSEAIGGPNPSYTTTLVCDDTLELTYTAGATSGVVTLPKTLAENATCTFTNTPITPAWTLTKTSDPASGSIVLPGSTITYTLTATPTAGTATATNVTVTDDLSGVLDNAVLQLPLPAGVTLSGTTLTWSIAALTSTATVSYSVKVNAGADGVTLTNVATPGSGGSCTKPADCTTTHDTPKWSLTKTAESVVRQGNGSWNVTYLLTVANTSTTVPVTYTLVDTPRYDASITANSAAVTASSDGSGPVPGVVNTWNGTTLSIVSGRVLAPGATDTYTVVVNATVPADVPPTIGDCVTGQPGHGFDNLATATSTSGTRTGEGCAPVPTGTPSWALVKTSNPTSGSSVDVGATVIYTLKATNSSTVPVTGAKATDTLPVGVTLLTPLAAGLTVSGRTLTWTVPDLAVGASVSVSYKVTVDDTAAGTSLTNVVVPNPPGKCTVASDCTTTTKVKQLIVLVDDSCKSDAAYLHYTISSKNVPNAANLPVTATWTLPNGTVIRVDTIPAGQLTGNLLWPGAVLNADGVAIGFPGWRDLRPSDFPLKSTDFVYGTQIEDPSLASFAYRSPLQVTFEMNPHVTVTVSYPGQTPAGCGVPREPDLRISKVASVGSIRPGQAFSYDIAVRNISTLAVAYPVVLADPIPADLKVTGISTAASGFPHWLCVVTGTDAEGYGGTLGCALSASLGVGATAPVVTLAVLARSTIPVGPLSNTATTCWKNPSLPVEAAKCEFATSTITVVSGPPLPNTGVPADRMAWLGIGLLLAGAALLGLGRRRRHLHWS